MKVIGKLAYKEVVTSQQLKTYISTLEWSDDKRYLIVFGTGSYSVATGSKEETDEEILERFRTLDSKWISGPQDIADRIKAIDKEIEDRKNNIADKLEMLSDKVNQINREGYKKASYILVGEDVMEDMKYEPKHKTTYNRDEVEVKPLGQPSDENRYMKVKYKNN